MSAMRLLRLCLLLTVASGASVARGQACDDFDYLCRFPWLFEKNRPVDYRLDSNHVISEINLFKWCIDCDIWSPLNIEMPSELTFKIESEKPIKFAMLYDYIRANFTRDTEFLQILSGPTLNSLTEIDYASWSHPHNGFTKLLLPYNPNSVDRTLFVRTRFQGGVVIKGVVSIYHVPEPSTFVTVFAALFVSVWRHRRAKQ